MAGAVGLSPVLIAIGAYADERPGECLGRRRLPVLCVTRTGLPCPEYGCDARKATAFSMHASIWWFLAGALVLVAGIVGPGLVRRLRRG